MTDTDARLESIDTLRQTGIANPARLVKLMRDAVGRLELDLSGLTVLTEAASGPYVVTPVIAALAGAERVLALTRDSRYASADAVIDQTRSLEALCGIPNRTEIFTERSLDLFAQADIVTNLGFVRPIEAQAVAAMKPTAVVPLMCEGWELRPGDVALEACERKGIPVLGTNEDAAGLEVFAYSGWLCLKMLFDAQVEVHKSKIVVASSDKFGRVILDRLSQSGVSARLLETLRDGPDIRDADAIVVADYTREDTIIGPSGDLTAAELATSNPAATVIQFAGQVDVPSLAEHGISVYPGARLEPHRMGATLAALGPAPVVWLHAAGLKVGQALAQARLHNGLGLAESIEFALAHSPAQRLQPQHSA